MAGVRSSSDGTRVGSRESLKVEDVLLAPGNRADRVVTARRGRSVLRAEPFGRSATMGAMISGGSASHSDRCVDLAIFEVRGLTSSTHRPVVRWSCESPSMTSGAAPSTLSP